ncbi:hypothetical protein RCC89_17630 [Cytophagaceae bacterium ABcell3]|nr:hypothetical protein RCC89_17630 [Cytophagaceae bacterium ABcell3]
MSSYTLKAIVLLGLTALFTFGSCSKKDPVPEEDQEIEDRPSTGGSPEVTLKDRLHGRWETDSIEFQPTNLPDTTIRNVEYPHQVITIDKHEKTIIFTETAQTDTAYFKINRDQLIIDEGERKGIYNILEVSSRRLIMWYQARPGDEATSSRPYTKYLSK